jgi:hypothetical protein
MLAFDFGEGKLREIPIVSQVPQAHIRNWRNEAGLHAVLGNRIATGCDIR